MSCVQYSSSLLHSMQLCWALQISHWPGRLFIVCMLACSPVATTPCTFSVARGHLIARCLESLALIFLASSSSRLSRSCFSRSAQPHMAGLGAAPHLHVSSFFWALAWAAWLRQHSFPCQQHTVNLAAQIFHLLVFFRSECDLLLLLQN